MAKHWIKLWTELLNDPKMGRLPDWQWRRCIEMFLLAGINDQDGLLQPVEEMAWILHCPAVTLREALQVLAEAGVVVLDQEERWWVKNFSKRQAPVPDAERKRLSRSKDNPVTITSRNVTDNVTEDSASSSASESVSDSVSDSLKTQEENKSGENFRFYENEIGVITPLISDSIQDAEKEYPEGWIQLAIHEAAEHNKRSWAYVEAILRRWKIEGPASDAGRGFQTQTRPGNGKKPDENVFDKLRREYEYPKK